MDLVVLGSGTLVPNGLRGPAGYVVADQDTCLLIDGGSGTLRRLAEAGVDFAAIDDVFITHIHPDHTGDLVPFLFALKNTPGLDRDRPVRLYGPPGFATFFGKLEGIYGRWIRGDYGVQVEELADRRTVRAGGLEVTAFAMQHSVNCNAYRIAEDGDGSVAYTGDTDPTEALVALCRGLDVLVADCSMPDAEKLPGHLTPGLVGGYATRGGARHVVLSHLYPACFEVDVAAECRVHYAGPVFVAHDLMRLRLRDGQLDVRQLEPRVTSLRWGGDG